MSIVFNGEIYNFSGIKKLLSGYEFKTLSDTEVILASIEIHGIDWFLERANGMFAFAIIDLRREQFRFAEIDLVLSHYIII